MGSSHEKQTQSRDYTQTPAFLAIVVHGQLLVVLLDTINMEKLYIATEGNIRNIEQYITMIKRKSYEYLKLFFETKDF